MYEDSKVSTWAVEDRPKEKIFRKGTGSMSDSELLSILIGWGTENKNEISLARELIAAAGGSLTAISKMSISDMMKVPGITKPKAIAISTAFELGRRRLSEEAQDKAKISTSRDVYDLMRFIGDLPHEEFWVILLNRANKVIEKVKISQGGIAGTVTDIRVIFKLAIEKLAVAIILSHNHPSGNKAPSEADVKITKKIKDTGDIMDVKLLDHIIVTDGDYYSFADEGLI